MAIQQYKQRRVLGITPPYIRQRRIFKEANKLWWLKPDLLILAILIPIYLGFTGFSYERFVPNTYIPGPEYWWGFLLLCTLGIGASIGRHFQASKPTLEHYVSLSIPKWSMFLLLALSTIAYIVWFSDVVLNPQWIAQILSGERDNLRDVVSTMPGVTTLTQCAIAYVSAYAIILHQPKRVTWWETAGFILIVILTLLRVLLWSERLSFIELSVAFLIAWFACYSFKSRTKFSIVNLAPLFAPILLYLIFTGTEYFRSWDFYRDYYSSIWEFSFDRLLAYYATASNNGIGLLIESKQWPLYTGAYVFEWAYAMPGIGPVLVDNLGNAKPAYDAFLENYARPELNNPSGIFPIVYDVGYFGSAVYFLALGIIIGMAWNAFRRKSLFGILIYPIFFVFLLEILRFHYIATSRFIPCFGAILIILLANHLHLTSPIRRLPLPLLTKRI
jgi:oligosaccharide repeat unit polymerase